MQRFGMMSRIGAVALGLVIAAATLVSVSAQVEAPPHHFYGTDGTAGDTIGLVDAMGNELGSATVDENGEWSISASVDPDTVSYTLNGKSADADTTSTGESQTQVSVTAMAMEEPAMEDGDELAGDDEDMEDLADDETHMEDGDGDETHMEDGDSTMEDADYPGAGSGGLADNSGVSAGLIGLLIALSVAAVAGLGLRRVRNRA